MTFCQVQSGHQYLLLYRNKKKDINEKNKTIINSLEKSSTVHINYHKPVSDFVHKNLKTKSADILKLTSRKKDKTNSRNTM